MPCIIFGLVKLGAYVEPEKEIRIEKLRITEQINCTENLFNFKLLYTTRNVLHFRAKKTLCEYLARYCGITL